MERMKTLGILGGLGPESTIDYYRLLMAGYRERRPDGSQPPVLINSIDLQKLVALVDGNELEPAAAYLAGELEKLARAGADFGLISANSPHMVFDEVQWRVSLPLISIVEAACEAASAQGLRRLGLLGARFTMDGRFYPEVFSRRSIEIVVPDDEERAYIHEKYMGELVKGVFLPKTKAALLRIARRLKKDEKIDGLLLAGTEVPLILRDAKVEGVAVLDTAQIHVQAALERMLEPEAQRG